MLGRRMFSRKEQALVVVTQSTATLVAFVALLVSSH
jgi:hypothetical protein